MKIVQLFQYLLGLFWDCCPEMCIMTTVAFKIMCEYVLYHSNKQFTCDSPSVCWFSFFARVVGI